MNRFVPLPFLLLVLGAVSLSAADDLPLGTGYRHDGTGVWPVKQAPVTWGHGKNVAWTLELPTWGNGGFCMADGKLFCMREARMGDPAEIGPQLLCIDPRKGEIMWERNVNQLGLHPPATAQKIQQEWTAEMALMRDYRALLKKLRELGKDQKQEIIATVKALQALGVSAKAKEKHPLPLDGRKPHRYDDPARWLPLGGQDRKQRRKFLKQHGCDMVAWSDSFPDNGNHLMGNAFCTPATDGEHVFVRTGHHVLACYDTDGEQRWLVQFSKKSGYTSYAPSPIVLGDSVVVYTVGSRSSDEIGLRVFDKRTGRQLYQLPQSDWAASYKLGQPAIFTLEGVDGPLAYLPDGRVVALADGKVLAEHIGWPSGGDNPLVIGDMIYVLNRQEGGGYDGGKHKVPKGLTAYRMSVEGGQLQVEQAWNNGEVSGHGLVHHGGLLFGTNRGDIIAVNAATGKQVVKRDNVHAGSWNLEIAAGKLYATDCKGLWSVLSADADLRLLAENDLSKPESEDHKGRMRTPSVSSTGPIAFYHGLAFIRHHDGIIAIAP